MVPFPSIIWPFVTIFCLIIVSGGMILFPLIWWSLLLVWFLIGTFLPSEHKSKRYTKGIPLVMLAFLSFAPPFAAQLMAGGHKTVMELIAATGYMGAYFIAVAPCILGIYYFIRLVIYVFSPKEQNAATSGMTK